MLMALVCPCEATLTHETSRRHHNHVLLRLWRCWENVNKPIHELNNNRDNFYGAVTRIPIQGRLFQ